MAQAKADERRQLFRLIGMANGYDNEADRKLVKTNWNISRWPSCHHPKNPSKLHAEAFQMQLQSVSLSVEREKSSDCTWHIDCVAPWLNSSSCGYFTSLFAAVFHFLCDANKIAEIEIERSFR